MTSIEGGASRLAGLLAEQLAAQRQAHGRSKAQSGKPSPATEAGHGEPRPQGGAAEAEQQQLLQALTHAVGHLAKDDAGRLRKAYRLFMQMVLARALGRSRFEEDTHFTRLLDSVLQEMEGDAQLLAQLREAGQLLLDAADGASSGPSCS